MCVYFLYSCGYEGLSQLGQRYACHRSGFQPPQPCEYFGQREQAYLLVRLSRTIVAAQHFPGRADTVESRIVQPQGVLFPVAEPVPFPVFQFRFQLGVDLRVVDARAVDGMLHEHADEPAASRRVGKQFARVGCADEGGDARQGLAVPPVRLAQVEGGELHEVLQERVFLLGYAVELIQVQQTHLGELSFHLVGTREVHAVGVVGLQLWWQQGAAEGGLSESLFVADEQGRGAVCVQSVGESGPLRGQSEHPPVEGLYPQGTVRHTGGQVVQPVAPVPCREPLEILPEGMVFPYIGRVHHACHVAVPAVDAVAVCFEADGIQVSFRGGPEGPVSLIRQVAEFRGFCEHVETELVSFGEEAAEGGFEVSGFRERFRLRYGDVGRTNRLSCRSFFVPPPYGIMCNPFEIHSSCV